MSMQDIHDFGPTSDMFDPNPAPLKRMKGSDVRPLSVSLLALLLSGLLAGCDQSEGRAPVASCSCANRPYDCQTATFPVGEGGKAYCAIWDGGQSCCLVVSR